MIGRTLRGAIVATGLLFLSLCYIVGPPAAAGAGSGGGLLIATGLFVGRDRVHPPGRRFGIPVPALIFASGPGEGSIEAALDELLRQRMPADSPVVLDNLRRSQRWIGGEAGVVLEGEARVRRDQLPGPGLAWRIGMWLAGIGTLKGAVAFFDRGRRRYAVGWVAWAGQEERVRAAFADAVVSLRWSEG